MLTRTIDWSLTHRWLVIAGTMVLAIAGLISFSNLPIDAFPDTTPTQVQINTVAPALGPLEVERQITVPIEQAIAGLPRVEEVRSLSRFGLSQVTIRFVDGTDIWFARQVTGERMVHAHLPPGVEPPSLGPVATGLGEVFHYLVTSKSQNLEELRTIHDWTIAPQLRSVAGVAEVNAWGGAEKQWHVIADPRRLQMFGLSLRDVYRALEENNANVGGGVVERGGGASLVLGIAILEDGGEVGEIVVAARAGVPIRIRDVARVEVGHEIRRGATTADGSGEVILGLAFLLMGENSHAVTQALAARLAEIQKSLPAGVIVEPVYQRTELVDMVLSTVEKNLFEGALLVIAVLFVFLGNLRAGLIVAAAIPLSMLFAFNGMLRFGIAGTLMSLGAIDFGLIVDSSVILIENAERRLAEASGNRSVLEVVRDAAVEVRKPTLFGELIIMIVYLPILTLEGTEGKLFRPMALTVIFALLGSAILSMTLMPVLASMVLEKGRARSERRLVTWLRRIYRPLLGWSLGHPKIVLGSAAFLVVAAVGAATRLGSEFIPRLSEGTIVINTVRLAEISLSESLRYGSQIEQVILTKFPHEVRRVWTRTGTAEVATDPMGVELSDVFVMLWPRAQWQRAGSQDELVAEIKAELADLPGMRMAFLQPIEMRVNEMIAGVRSDLGIKVFGDDIDVLKATARQIESVVRSVEGATDVTVEQVTGQPVLEVRVDRAAIARHGIPARAVLDVVEALGTRKVGQVKEGDRRFDLAVRLGDEYRNDPAMLATVPVPAPAGGRVPLGQLATIREVSGPSTIQREWGKRRLVVQANVRGRDLGSFVADVRSAIEKEIPLPTGYYLRFGGQFEHLERAQARLMVVVPVALALIFMLLYMTYQRVVDALRVFIGVPFALVGGVFALLICDLPFSVSAAVGFVALSGVSVLGDMVLVSRVRQLLSRGAELHMAIEEAALSRLRPVLMTAAVAALGFVPMAVNTGVGAEVQRPLATVVIGGVLSSTFLTLIVLPVLYAAFGARQAPAAVDDEEGGTGHAPSHRPIGSSAMRALGFMVWIVLAIRPAAAGELVDVDEAVARALMANPDIITAQAEVGAAEAAQAQAGLVLQGNPNFQGAAGGRRGDDATVEYSVQLSQPIEIGGQRSARMRGARARVEAARARLAWRRIEVAASVRESFGRALATQRLLEVARENEANARQAMDAAVQRFEAGDISRLESNAARVGRARALQEHNRAQQDAANALAELQLLMALPQQEGLALQGQLNPTSPPAEQLPSSVAVESRADVRAARFELEAAQADNELAGREWLPSPNVGASFAHEEGAEIVQGVFGVDLPVLNRNQAGRGAAAARVTQAQEALDACRRRAQQELRLASLRLRLAEQAVSAFATDVVDAMRENLDLGNQAYEAGQIDFMQLLLMRRESSDARRDHVQALTELDAAHVELQRVNGK